MGFIFMKVNLFKQPSFSFKGEPPNYAKISNTLSRSAQPNKEDFKWLKDNGVTDIINFRTMVVSSVDYDEATEVSKLGMKYHNLPSITSKPTKENVDVFIDLVNNIERNGGKAHIHCKAGADRTGMYSFIYKEIKGIGSILENEKEWIARGHNIERYPNLRDWTKNLLKIIK